MNPIIFTSELNNVLEKRDEFCISVVELRKLSDLVLGVEARSWVRQLGERGIIAHAKFGTDARHLEQEFKALAEQISKITGACSPENQLRAAAYFHLRFENIHPLKDGNGRIGRLLLAADCSRFSGIGVQEFLDAMGGWVPAYRQVFTTEEPAVQFELLLDLLARLLGMRVADCSLPFSTKPVYPEQSRKPVQRVRVGN